jgi:hypothetical protein
VGEVVDAALDHDRVRPDHAVLEPLDDLIGAFPADTAVADLEVGVLALGPVLPLAPGVVAEVKVTTRYGIRVIAGVAGGDRIAERGDQPLIAAAPAAAAKRQRSGREGGRCD